MTRDNLAAHHVPAWNTAMGEIQKIRRVTFRELTNEEALQKYGSSFVFVGSRPGRVLSKRRRRKYT